MEDEDYDKSVENYLLENEDILKEHCGSRRREEGRIEFSNLTNEEKLNFLYS